MTARKNPDPPPPALPSIIPLLGQHFSGLPGVGEKTGLRFAINLALGDPTRAAGLAEILARLHETIAKCDVCGGIAERVGDQATCPVCRDRRRDTTLLCIVARVQDMLAIERAGVMRGRYFVLGALLSPLDGFGTDDLPMEQLHARIDAGVREVLIATPPSVDGEATAMLIGRQIGLWYERDAPRVTRLASGVAHGSDLEFADQVTLGRAIESRAELR